MMGVDKLNKMNATKERIFGFYVFTGDLVSEKKVETLEWEDGNEKII